MFTRKFIALFVVVLILFVTAAAYAEPEFYSKSTVIVDISIGTDVLVTVEDAEGNLWNIHFELDEDTDIELGDVVSMFMWNCGTPDYIFDDEVIDAVDEHFKAL